MLDTDELLARLDANKIRNIDIARVLNLPDSRVPEIKTKRRALKLDEAAKLVRAFALEPNSMASPLPHSVLRLVVQYVAVELGISPQEHQLAELTEDVRAFSEFVAEPKVRRSAEAAEAFFQAMRLRRPKSVEAAQPGSDPARVR